MKKAIVYVGALLLTLGVYAGNDSKTKKSESEIIQTKATGTNIGDLAPEIKLMNPDGKEVSLSSMKGKVVLIDFWASWCGPCRKENPNVVAAYQKYKGAKMKDAKGFDIYSVSLDSNKDNWVKAIQQDALNWPAHVSDLKGWRSEAGAQYGVNSIPMNFLIDANGVIVGKNLRGEQLHIAIDKLVKKL